VQSKSRAGNPEGKAFEFKKAPNAAQEELNFPFEGMKVDVFDKTQEQWMPGEVKAVNKINAK